MLLVVFGSDTSSSTLMEGEKYISDIQYVQSSMD
jgi:hypothetical protein